MKTENLKNAYALIKSGLTINCNGCQIWVGPMRYRNGEPYGRQRAICWQHYGRSATRMTLGDLRWIMKVIAGSDDYSYTVVYD